MSSLLGHPSSRFAFAALTVLVVCAGVVRWTAGAANADVAAWGATFDLTLTIPLLFWFFVVRSGKAHAITIAPVFLACLWLATMIVPRGDQEFLHDLKVLVVPLEIAVVATIARGAMRGESRVAEVVMAEVAMFDYGLFGWLKKPEAVPGRAITFHERSGWGTIVAAILLLIAAEGVGVHLLLSRWTTIAAWAWTFLDVWGALWLIGDYHALRVRRSWLDENALHIRMGMRWSVDIALTNIASIEETGAWKRKGVLKVAILEEPRWLITLRDPLLAKGLAGIRKEIHALALLPDDDEFAGELLAALERNRQLANPTADLTRIHRGESEL